MSEVLSEAERGEALMSLERWSWLVDRSGIFRTFRFADFSQAFSFMTRVAMAAERADHHPEWSNVWNSVDIFLSTHSAGGLTMKDVDLARRIDLFAHELAVRRE